MYKTFSSPNLKDKTSSKNLYSKPTHSDDCDQQLFIVGDRVLVDKFRAGSVAFFGELDFSSGDWVGVVLDEPSGNHDGKIHGREYFHCAPQHGLFVRPTRLTRLAPADDAMANEEEEEDSIAGYQRYSRPSSRTSSRSATPAYQDGGYRRSLSEIHSRPRSEQQQYNPTATYRSPSVNSNHNNYSSGRSTTESCYYYDDDYRNPLEPSIESLERKLKSINTKQWQRDQPVEQQRARSVLSSPYSTTSMSPVPQTKTESVFNFRPQRIHVDEYARSPQPTNLRPSQSMGKLLDFSNKMPLQLHDRIVVKSLERNVELRGTLRYLGETQFATGEWAGVELDDPEGRNDGSILGVRYFYCADNHGLFVPACRVAKLNPRVDFTSSLKSTIKSPPPPKTTTPLINKPTSLASNGRSTPASGVASSERYASTTPSSLSPSSLSPTPPGHNETKYYYKWKDDDTKATGERATKIQYQLKQQQPANYSSSSVYSSSNLSLGSASNKSGSSQTDKFKESDLDNALKRYTTTRRPIKFNSPVKHYGNSHGDQQLDHNYQTTNYQQRPQARSIKYTFKSCKYDGNPIAMKTVQYDDDDVDYVNYN